MKIITNLLILLLTAILLTTPLLAADYYVDATNGSDSNDGKTTNSAWKYAPGMSLATGNAASASLSPGDMVYFKMGEMWRDTLTINASGSEGNPITFAAKSDWGTEDNPKILSSEQVSSWTKIDTTHHIWRATVSGKTSSFGMLNSAGTERVDAYQSMPGYPSWADKYFYGRTGNSYVYFKNDAGDPGTREVGVRPYCIIGDGKSYITVDGIDAYGPIGTHTDHELYEKTYLAKKRGPISFRNSSHITIKNCSVGLSSSVGIGFWEGGTNSVIEDCSITDTWGGAWWNVCGSTHRISRCHITNIALRYGDTGDKDMIGAYITGDIIVEDCYLDTSGNPLYDENGNGITFANCNGQIIRRNYIKDAAHSGISVGGNNTAGSYGVQIYNNIVDDWGRLTGVENTWYEGIIIGSGGTASSTYGNVLVYNNLLINGANSNTLWDKEGDTRGNVGNAGIRILNNKFGDVKVINNLFHNNDSIYEFTWDVSQYTGTRDISYNFFYRTHDNAIGVGVDWGRGTTYAYNNITSGSNNWQDKTSYVRNNYQNSLSNYPKLAKTSNGTYTLTTDTPDIIKTGGTNIYGEDYNIVIHPDRIWTPFKKMNNLTIKRDNTYSIGPFGINDNLVLGKIPSPTGFKVKIW